MDWKKEKLQSFWKMSKEKLIFLFCSGLLLFILALPDGEREAKEVSAGAQGTAGNGSWDTGTQGAAGSWDWDTEAQGTAGNVGGDGMAEGQVPAGASGQAAGQDTYEADLERRIREILAGVDGVGEVDVMVILKSSEEKILHVDQNSSSSVTEEKTENGTSRIISQQELSESTVMGSQNQTPIVEKELKPEVAGIVISADGGGSAVIKAEISEAMEALFGLPAHKIKVLKRVKKGV